MRILLVQPDNAPSPSGFRLVALSEPLALELLADMVPDHEVEILDMRLDPDLDAALVRFAPDVVAITALTTEVYAAVEVLATVKRFCPEIFTVVGGHHATLLPEDFQYPFVDSVCLGEGEFVFAKLIETLGADRDFRRVPNLIWQDGEGRFVRNARVIPKVDADLLARPRRDLVARHRPHYTFMYRQPDTAITTGRGCPYRCNFCSVWSFYEGMTREMSARRVLEELREVTTPTATFMDDNFLLNARREHEIVDLIQAEGIRLRFGAECRADSVVRDPELIEKLAGIGMEGALLGLEGITDDDLVHVNKRSSARINNEAIRILQANGMMVWGAFIVDPDWTGDQFHRLHEYVYEKRITHTQFTVLTPLPGTPLYRAKHHELLTHDYTCFDTLHPVVPTRLPREEFYRHFAALYLKPNLDHVWQAVRQGLVTMDQVRYGHRIYREMGRWESYLENDPVLRQRLPADERLRQLISQGRPHAMA